MKEDNKNKINRRDFFKLAGAGTLASAAALYGCSGNKNNGESESAALGEISTDKMTYRTNPNTGDRVSLLGYGCMRWPTRKRADGNGDEIDQEAVNDLIDYAIAHGVNYFDTSPAYVQGLSERATGIALKRHPREKFFLATKLSNFSPSTHSREESLAMYHRSFRDLQVDYIDYLLLHGIGMGGMEYAAADGSGRIRNTSFADYLIPTSMDVPHMECVLNTAEYPEGPYGAKGAGELPTVGGASAYLQAMEQCMARPLNHVPYTMDDIMAGLREVEA